jgi:hypothetical protein
MIDAGWSRTHRTGALMGEGKTMIWLGDLIAEKAWRQAAGPVRHGHLLVYEGGKVASGCYVKRAGIWQRLWKGLSRKKTSVQIYRLDALQD